MGGIIARAAVLVQSWGALVPAEIAMELAMKALAAATKSHRKQPAINALVGSDGISVMLITPIRIEKSN